jgi:hypothetical protein
MGKRQTKLEVNLTKFHERMREIQKYSGRTFADELNKQMLQLVIGAKGSRGLVQLTQKATEAQIRADLAKTVTYRFLAGKAHTGPLSRVLAAQWLRRKGVPITRVTLHNAEQQIIDRRTKFRRAYIAASWLYSAQRLAKSVKGNTLTRLNDGDIPQVKGGKAEDAADKTIAAQESKLRTVVFNTAVGASKIARKAIPRALANATKDMGAYIARQWAKNLKAIRAGR